MTDIEKVTAFNNIRTFLNKEQQNLLSSMLGLNTDNLEIRLRGLKDEDEFYLVMYFLDVCEHMISFDEGVSVLTESYQPDVLLKLKNGKKVFVEIKSAKGNTFKISQGNLQNKINFAKDFDIPLYFAIKMRGVWTLFPSEYMQSKSGKISFYDDLEFSLFNDFFGSFFCLFIPGIKAESLYSKSLNPIGSIQNNSHGNLISYKLFFQDQLILNADKNAEEDVKLSFFLENLHDAMSNQSQEIVEIDSDKTLVIETLINPLMCMDYFFFLSPIKHTIHCEDQMCDSTTFFKSFLVDRKMMMKKEILDKFFKVLSDKGLPFLYKSSIKVKKDPKNPENFVFIIPEEDFEQN